MPLPNDLVEALRRHDVVPFVGAGVSLGIKRGLFPGWRELLEALAVELENQQLQEAAAELRHHLAGDNLLEAAEVGLQQLGAHRFNRFLRGRFRVPKPSDAELAVVRALWALRPPLILTTNYDDVLAWGAEHAERLANDQPDELALMHAERNPDAPRIWHLHGTIHRLSTVILGGSDYERLYGALGDGPGAPRDDRSRQQVAYRGYAWAVSELDKQLSSRSFLYVGFSFNDEYVLRQVKHVLQATRGKTAPSYALMKKGQGNRAHLWSQYNIQLIEYADHGTPLVELLEELRRTAFPAPAAPKPSPPPAAPLSLHLEAADDEAGPPARSRSWRASRDGSWAAPARPVPRRAPGPGRRAPVLRHRARAPAASAQARVRRARLPARLRAAERPRPSSRPPRRRARNSAPECPARRWWRSTRGSSRTRAGWCCSRRSGAGRAAWPGRWRSATASASPGSRLPTTRTPPRPNTAACWPATRP